MSISSDIDAAVKALVKAALPAFEVKGLSRDAAFPERVPEDGLIVVRPGTPGEPTIDLCPVSYNWERRIAVEIATLSGDVDAQDQMNVALVTLGEAIMADRFLGGLVDWLDATANGIEDSSGPGTAAHAFCEVSVIATYATNNPLA